MNLPQFPLSPRYETSGPYPSRRTGARKRRISFDPGPTLAEGFYALMGLVAAVVVGLVIVWWQS